jgi:hypothetical protein
MFTILGKNVVPLKVIPIPYPIISMDILVVTKRATPTCRVLLEQLIRTSALKKMSLCNFVVPGTSSYSQTPAVVSYPELLNYISHLKHFVPRQGKQKSILRLDGAR